MKRAVFSIFIIQISIVTYTQEFTLEQCKEKYKDALYEEIIPSLDSFSGDIYRQNSFTINFMLGSSLCRSGNQVRGQKVLKWITSNYDLDPRQLRIINKEMTGSGTVNSIRPDLEALMLWYNRSSNAGVRSKVFINFKPDETNASSPSRMIDSSLNREYPLRIIKLGTEVKYDSFPADRKMIPNFLRSEHFLLFGDSGKNTGALEIISAELEKTLDFYLSYFRLVLPENYINVYILSSVPDLARFARTCHRIKLADNTLGYTFEPDHSIAGALPSNPAGTLKHELVHLLIHQNFQAVPPWIDEGLAALYEVSVFKDTILAGMNNWRGNIIKDNRSALQANEFSLRTILTEYSWDRSKNEERYQALINAISRYFFLYLQQNRLLREYILAIKEYSPGSSDKFFIDAVEKVSGKSFDDFNKGFYQWLTETVM
jgi:hypothetical protein